MRYISKQCFESFSLTSANRHNRALQSPSFHQLFLDQRVPFGAVSNLLPTNLGFVDLPDLSVLAGNPSPKATQTARGSRGALFLFGDAARLMDIFHLRARLSVSLDNLFSLELKGKAGLFRLSMCVVCPCL